MKEKMGGQKSEEKEEKLLVEKGRPEPTPNIDELTLPEKLCQFYVEKPKLAFGMFAYSILFECHYSNSVSKCS